MPAKLIFSGVYALGLGPVNAFLVEDGTALAKLTFATVCFGHGPALNGANARKFNQKWEA